MRAYLFLLLAAGSCAAQSFQLMETTIADVHKAYKSGKLTARQLTQMYLDRIEAYDKSGPKINCVITINPKALEEAGRVDEAYKSSGPWDRCTASPSFSRIRWTLPEYRPRSVPL